ncbi:MAG: 6-bladed beta-propeller [Bacteroidales bacterium]|jgi:hypothetical protein|nr:6-bladed beta-propeller [Bacteroidales bacterium]
MEIKVQFIIVVLLCSKFFFSCKISNPKIENDVLTFDLKEMPKQTTLKLTDLGATDIQYIPLETNEQCLILRIQKIIKSNNFFLIQSFTDILMFRNDGSYITKIGTVGRGPNEFTVAHDVNINPTDGTIYLIDGWQQKFLVYSNKGEFIRTFKYPIRAAVNFEFTHDGILCYNKNNIGDIETSYLLIDTNGKIIKSYPNKYPWKRNAPTLAFQCENIFYRNNGQLIKKEIYCDTLFAFIDKNFYPHSVIDIGKLRLTPNFRTESDVNFITENFINPMNLFQFSNFIYYEFHIPINGHIEGLSFIGSKDGKFRVLFDPEEDLINDLDGGPSIWPKSAWDDMAIVTWTDALRIKTFVLSEKFKSSNPKYTNKKKDLENLAESLKETDNPVLILIKLN